jgi:hypothetical protein
MKTLLTITIAVICLLTNGCKSTGNLIATSFTTVDHAMQAWAVYVVDGKATMTQELAVREAKLKYDVAEDTAVAAYVKLASGDKVTWAIARDHLIQQRENLLNLLSVLTGKAIR